MKKLDLTWGESVVVRKSFLEQTHGIPIQFGLKELGEMDYTPFNGDAKLILETAKVIKRQTGLEYKHIFLTNGASGGCTIALRAYHKVGFTVAATNPGPFFPLYPLMARAAGMAHSPIDPVSLRHSSVFLLDSPANPSGEHVGVSDWAWNAPIIWDAVYHNNVYMSLHAPAPKHDVVVGSYSKLTGLNGIRLGWIATNNDDLAETIGKLIAPEYCGLSKPSKMILSTLIDQFNNDPEYYWGSFEQRARFWLDTNREEWSKLEKYFQGTPVPINGMFYYAKVDEGAKKLLDKAGVSYQYGSKCGTDDSFGRFNIGQDPKVIKDAVKAILKSDKI